LSPSQVGSDLVATSCETGPTKVWLGDAFFCGNYLFDEERLWVFATPQRSLLTSIAVLKEEDTNGRGSLLLRTMPATAAAI
jgi:hypothetical protein